MFYSTFSEFIGKKCEPPKSHSKVFYTSYWNEGLPKSIAYVQGVLLPMHWCNETRTNRCKTTVWSWLLRCCESDDSFRIYCCYYSWRIISRIGHMLGTVMQENFELMLLDFHLSDFIKKLVSLCTCCVLMWGNR